jgi:hypothetical protein
LRNVISKVKVCSLKADKNFVPDLSTTFSRLMEIFLVSTHAEVERIRSLVGIDIGFTYIQPFKNNIGFARSKDCIENSLLISANKKRFFFHS